MQSIGNSKHHILNIVGTLDDEYLVKINLFYVKGIDSQTNYRFTYLLVTPDNKVSHHESFEDLEDYKNSSSQRLDISNIKNLICKANPSAIILHAYGYTACTTLRKDLENLSYPIFGARADVHFVCSDKAETRRILLDKKVNVAPGCEIRQGEEIDKEQLEKLGFPLVLKSPKIEDSKGVIIVKEPKDLDQAISELFTKDNIIVAEKFISGREIRTGVIERLVSGEKQLYFLPAVEYIIGNDNTRSFDDKYNMQGNSVSQVASTRVFLDAEKEKELYDSLRTISFNAFQALNVREYGLFDIRVDSVTNTPYILECNLFGSFNKNSFLNLMWRHDGGKDQELLDLMYQNVLRRVSSHN